MTNVPDWLAALGLILPALTGLAGYFLAGRNEESRGERAAQREATAHRFMLSARLEGQHAFQRETLLELKGVVQRQMRYTARATLHDQTTLRNRRTLTQRDPDLAQESYQLGVATRPLQARVLDANLRSAIEEFPGFAATIQASSALISKLTADNALKHLAGQLSSLPEHHRSISEKFGVCLRNELGLSIQR